MTPRRALLTLALHAGFWAAVLAVLLIMGD